MMRNLILATSLARAGGLTYLRPPAVTPTVSHAHAVPSFLDRLRRRYRIWREARATIETLAGLDDNALRDIGIHRDEIVSKALVADSAHAANDNRPSAAA